MSVIRVIRLNKESVDYRVSPVSSDDLNRLADKVKEHIEDMLKVRSLSMAEFLSLSSAVVEIELGYSVGDKDLIFKVNESEFKSWV